MDSNELAWRIRRHAIEMTHVSNGSHIASALSMADIIAVLYARVMKYDIDHPKAADRDRFLLSKGHAGSAIYAALAEVGFFSTDLLTSHMANGSILSGHVSHKDVPGVEFSTGSLGHGIGVAAGMAFAAGYDQKQHHVYVVIGDGECDEGSVWEAALFANHYKLDRLTVIIDHNKMQSLRTCEETISLGNLTEKWRQFGWEVLEIDGHNHTALEEAFSLRSDKPKCIVANTVKGKGISFMEHNILWHYRAPQGEDYETAIKELEASRP